MKKTLNFIKTKILMFVFALILPLSATGLSLSLNDYASVNADTDNTTTYHVSFKQEKTLTNSNFNSGNSNYSISNSISGWTGQLSDGKTTGGYISVGSVFSTYTDTYRLSNNPGKDPSSSDYKILMINSKTEDSSNTAIARQGYKSSSITLEANSFYSFQVAFKSDTNYNSHTEYIEKGDVNLSDTYVSKSHFEGKDFNEDGSAVYVIYDHRIDTSKTFFVEKKLSEYGTITENRDYALTEFFYKDQHYVGTLDTDGTPIFIKISDMTGDEENGYVASAGTKTYACNLTYSATKTITENGTVAETTNFENVFYNDGEYIGVVDGEEKIYFKLSDVSGDAISGYEAEAGTKKYKFTYNASSSKYYVEQGVKYYDTTTEYTSLNDYTFGSIYLSGLKDKDGNDVKADFVKISSKEWQTFYFFVATGDTEQSVTLDLWLGSENVNQKSSGVVFFDNCRVYQYSENAFWNTYNSYKNKSFTQEYLVGGTLKSETTKCTSLLNLEEKDLVDTSSYNFDFENGTYTGNSQPVSKWTKSGSGFARVFNANSAESFKSITGYDFVGSDLSCRVDFDNNFTVTQNQYFLGLWADNQTVKLTSSDISIDANTVYKITAYYKVSALTSGSAYMFVSENNNVLSAYNLSQDYYTVAEEVSSSALSSNGSSSFNNEYNKVEFFVKGGNLYPSSINISLGLGNGTETATGCVAFDNITIEKSSTSDFDNASNKIELDAKTTTLSVLNGNFNSSLTSKDATAPFAPTDWTIASEENKISFAGVINTQQEQYSQYVEQYYQYKAKGLTDDKNPYYWALIYTTPKNSSNSLTDMDNVLMISNVSSTWQNVTASVITLESNSYNRIEFSYKTNSSINITLTDANEIKLFEAKNVTSNGNWTKYAIYIKTSNEANVTLKIDFGTEDNKVSGVAYFDNFIKNTISESLFTEKFNSSQSNEDIFGAVDMSGFYENLPTNKITTEVNIDNAPAYEGSISTGNAESNSGAIIKSNFFDTSSSFRLDEEKDIFYFSNQNVGSYVIQSKFPVALSEGYYVLTFKAQTQFVTDKDNLNSEKTYNYGLTVGFTDFDYMKNIICDGEYKEYSIFIHVSESKTANLYISFVSDHPETCGIGVVYDVALNSSTEDEYNDAKSTASAKNYDVNDGRVIASKAIESADEEEEEKEESSENQSSSLSDLDWSLIISGSITGLAIILAVVFSILRNVKIKKIEYKRREAYDRKSSLELAVIKRKAEKEQANEIKEVQTSIDSFAKELNTLEKEHKEKVVELRKQDQGKVSKQTDREFKDFAKKRAVISEKIETLEKQKQELSSKEHLLSLERKIFAKEEMENKNLEKSSKAKNKADEKNSK